MKKENDVRKQRNYAGQNELAEPKQNKYFFLLFTILGFKKSNRASTKRSGW